MLARPALLIPSPSFQHARVFSTTYELPQNRLSDKDSRPEQAQRRILPPSAPYVLSSSSLDDFSMTYELPQNCHTLYFQSLTTVKFSNSFVLITMQIAGVYGGVCFLFKRVCCPFAHGSMRLPSGRVSIFIFSFRNFHFQVSLSISHFPFSNFSVSPCVPAPLSAWLRAWPSTFHGERW